MKEFEEKIELEIKNKKALIEYVHEVDLNCKEEKQNLLKRNKHIRD